MNAPADLTINHLRCPLPARQPVVARLALETLAAEVAAAPAALPPQSLLVVRQLALTVPGLNLARLPDSAQRQAAAQDAGSLLADAWTQAARPALGEVSPQANAVCFGDAAELLACIARDGLAGRLDRWWWRTLLGSAFPDWRQAWVRRPEAAPAALRLLAREGLENVVRRALDGPAAAVFATEVATTTTAPAAPPAQARPIASDTPPVASPERPALTANASPAAHRAPPAEPTTPTPPAPAARTPPRPHLLPADAARPRASATPPIADPAPATEARPLAAASTPSAVPEPVAPAFAVDAPPPGRPAATAPAVPPHPAADADMPPAANPAARPTAAAPDADEAPASGSPVVPPPATGAGRTAGPTSARTPAAARAPGLDAEIGRLLAVGDRLRPPPSAPASRPGAALAPASPTSPTDAPGWPLDATPIPVRSRHARLFFLINLLLGDGLYPDFTQPATAAFPVPIWRLLALLGSGLAGPALRDDPVWPLLNQLADELPTGADCAFARDWPIPPARPPARRRQGQPPAHQAAPAIRPRTLRHARPQGFTRWLADYRHSLRHRLAAALALPPALLGRAFLQDDSAALIWVSAAEIVVVQPLDEHPVAWRLAGLDRDPGFLPSAGRSLRFIFS